MAREASLTRESGAKQKAHKRSPSREKRSSQEERPTDTLRQHRRHRHRRSKSRAPLAPPKGEAGVHASAPIDDVLGGFLYRPRTVTVLALLMAALLYQAFFGRDSPSQSENTLQGIAVASIFFVLYGVTQFKNGPFIRPHPAIWRGVQAASIIYLVLLIFLFFQNLSDARLLLRHVDASLGVALPERSYAADCSFTWANIKDNIDVFVLSHALGWYVKALILRDTWILWIISVMFEVLEYSLEHQLPNFGECWWDHWLMDVLICNWAGIWLGMRTCKYLALKTYSWRRIQEIPSIKGKVGRTFAQFSPHDWATFDWGGTRTLKGYLSVLAVVTLFLMAELNCFYLKNLLWIPTVHYINFFRLLLLVLMGAVSLRESYAFFSDPLCKRLGTQAWLNVAIVCTETLICVKFGRGIFTKPAPRAVVNFWIGLTTLLVAFPIWQFFLLPKYAARLSRT